MRQGEHARAADAAERMVRHAFEPAGDAYRAASLLARCAPVVAKDVQLSEAERREQALTYAGRAVELLRQANARGYKDVERLKKDKHFDPLHAREDFQQLLRQLEAEAKPDAR